jgi:hypothetical protein
VDSDRLQTNVARLIVVISVFGAIASWRASIWSETAATYDQQTAQEQVVAEQASARSQSTVALDLRLLGPAEEAFRSQKLLERDARRAAAAGDAQLAAELRVEARRRRLEGNTLGRYAQSGFGYEIQPDGGLTYDAEGAREFNETIDPDLEGLRPEETRRLGEEAHDRSVRLVLASATFVLALFFLTVSQLGGARRRSFAAVGILVALTGATLFALA